MRECVEGQSVSITCISILKQDFTQLCNYDWLATFLLTFLSDDSAHQKKLEITNISSGTFLLAYMRLHLYIYIYVCVCVCVVWNG